VEGSGGDEWEAALDEGDVDDEPDVVEVVEVDLLGVLLDEVRGDVVCAGGEGLCYCVQVGDEVYVEFVVVEGSLLVAAGLLILFRVKILFKIFGCVRSDFSNFQIFAFSNKLAIRWFM